MLACSIVLATATLGGSSASAVGAPVLQEFLKLDGIPGEVAVKGYDQWIPVSDVTFGVDAAQGVKTAFKDIQLDKVTDVTSPQIIQAAALGTVIKNATIAFTKPSGTGLARVNTIYLTNVSVTSYKFVDGIETVTLGYSTISFGAASQKADGTVVPNAKSVGWDRTKMIRTTPVFPQ